MSDEPNRFFQRYMELRAKRMESRERSKSSTEEAETHLSPVEEQKTDPKSSESSSTKSSSTSSSEEDLSETSENTESVENPTQQNAAPIATTTTAAATEGMKKIWANVQFIDRRVNTRRKEMIVELGTQVETLTTELTLERSRREQFEAENQDLKQRLQEAENTAVVLLHNQLLVAEAKVANLEQQLSLERHDRFRQDQSLQLVGAQVKSLIDEQKIQNEKISLLMDTCDKLTKDLVALSQSENVRSVSGPLGEHGTVQLIPNDPIELPASSSTTPVPSHHQESKNADLAAMSNGGSDEVENMGQSQEANETEETIV